MKCKSNTTEVNAQDDISRYVNAARLLQDAGNEAALGLPAKTKVFKELSAPQLEGNAPVN